MRMTLPIKFATAALIAASPAFAQNDTNAAQPPAANEVATENANAAAPVDVNAAPAAPEVTETTPPAETAAPPPAPAESRGFPWGVLGLLGLLGFAGRARRR